MAQVPGSAFSFQDVINVFGGSGSFQDYYRGGPFVPDIAQNKAIAAWSGGLELAQFANATNTSPISGYFSGNNNPSCSIIKGQTQCTAQSVITMNASGGSGGNTYTWSVTWGTASITPNGNTCTVWQTGGVGQDMSQAIIQCVVRDSSGNSGTFTVTYTFGHISLA